MLSISYIEENRTLIEKSAREKGIIDLDIASLLQTHETLKRQKQLQEELRNQRNQNARAAKEADESTRPQLVAIGGRLKEQIQIESHKVTELEQRLRSALLTVPNVIADDTPSGEDDSSNISIRKHGKPTEFDFKPRDHLELGTELDLIDFPAGAKVTGEGFYFLKNEAVLLELALTQFALRKAISHGFVPLRTPELAKNDILIANGYSPKGEESNTYELVGRDLSLIATAEIPVGGYHSAETIDIDRLPLKYVAYSDCFRTEAGGGGKSSKGLYRVHQFGKVELYVLCHPEQSDAILEEIVQLEEEINQDLGVPYQVVRICAGDLGAPAYKKYDLEAWMPGRNGGSYGEITSASSCTDFQARRLGIRYKAASGKNEFLHTLNGTAVALSRTLIAILENNQNEDGSVRIPEVLVSSLGFDTIRRK